jgi:hypothetical protein
MSLSSCSPGVLGGVMLAAAATTTPMLCSSDATLDALSALVPDPRYGSLIGSLVLFGAPAVFAGMVSPYCVRLLVANAQTAGHSAGRLYFVSTLGSASGTIITSFYAVLWAEVTTIVGAMAAVTGVIGAALLGCAWWQERRA